MSVARYFVFNRGDDWLVTLDGDLLVKHPNRLAATNSAVVMADLMGAMQHEADVMVEENGRLEIAWTYGADPLPNIERTA